MDKIVLIGNGFDLAHGLPTRYSDFLLWHINTVINMHKLTPDIAKNDELVRLNDEGYRIPPLNSLDELQRRKEIQPLGSFFQEIIKEWNFKKWVDIEYLFYAELLEIYKNFELNKVERHSGFEGNIQALNRSFEYLENRLIEYLSTIDISKIEPNDQIINHLLKEKEYKEGKNKHRSNSITYLVFNYTKTLETYNDLIDLNKGLYNGFDDKIIYIHGKLSDKKNPIIFGYGDEKDVYYERMERLNLNEFTKNFKSFKYLRTDNYSKLFNLIPNRYELIVMGHSCGISDRVLLTELFNPDHCNCIKILHHKRQDGSTDFYEKTQEISRHFASDLKHVMRQRIINYGPLIE